MRFTMAVPQLLLDKLEPLQDLHFALAQHCENDEYAAWFHKRRANGDHVILDNGFHELGAPLPVSELSVICEKVKPTFVIAPDWLGFPKKTLEAYRTMIRAVPSGTRVAVVLQGQDGAERFAFFEAVRAHATMLCLPFRAERLSWFRDLLERVPAHMPWPPYIHLLGAKNADELNGWRSTLEQHNVRHMRISIDTTKPIKFGIDKKMMEDFEQWRGNGGWPTEPAPKEVTEEQLAYIYRNIAYFRRFL